MIQGAGIQAHLATGARLLPFGYSGAQGERGYPLIVGATDPALRPGDQVLRLGNLDLQGLSSAEIAYRADPLRREGRPIEVELERDGARFVAVVEPVPNPYWWWAIPVWGSLALTATFLLLRARHWHLARRMFAGLLLWCCFGGSLAPIHPGLVFLGVVVAQSLAMGLCLSAVFDWVESMRPAAWLRALPWLIGLAEVGATADNVLTFPLGSRTDDNVVGIVYVALIIAGLAVAYRRSPPLGRRQLRWIFLGNLVGTVPRAAFLAVAAVASIPGSMPWNQLSFLCVIALPLGIAISVVGYHWLDIDRLISASAAATLVGIALLGGALAVVPPSRGRRARRSAPTRRSAGSRSRWRSRPCSCPRTAGSARGWTSACSPSATS